MVPVTCWHEAPFTGNTIIESHSTKYHNEHQRRAGVDTDSVFIHPLQPWWVIKYSLLRPHECCVLWMLTAIVNPSVKCWVIAGKAKEAMLLFSQRMAVGARLINSAWNEFNYSIHRFFVFLTEMPLGCSQMWFLYLTVPGTQAAPLRWRPKQTERKHSNPRLVSEWTGRAFGLVCVVRHPARTHGACACVRAYGLGRVQRMI